MVHIKKEINIQTYIQTVHKHVHMGIQTNRHTNMTAMHPSMLCEYPSTKSINTCHETQRIRERLRDRDKDREIERETGTKTEK